MRFDDINTNNQIAWTVSGTMHAICNYVFNCIYVFGSALIVFVYLYVF